MRKIHYQIKRIEDFKSKLDKLDNANNLLVGELVRFKKALKPHHDKFDQLQIILKENYEKNQKSSLIAFNNDFNKLDKKLELLFKERDTLLDKKNQFALNKERINNSLKLLYYKKKTCRNLFNNSQLHIVNGQEKEMHLKKSFQISIMKKILQRRIQVY